MFYNNKIKKLENDLKSQMGNLKKELEDKICKNNAEKSKEVERLKTIMSFMVDASDYQIYKVKNRESYYMTWDYLFPHRTYMHDVNPKLYTSITIDELQKLGSYKTFTIGEETCVLAKKKSKIGRPKGSKNSK